MKKKTHAPRNNRFRKLQLEPLEERQMLAVGLGNLGSFGDLVDVSIPSQNSMPALFPQPKSFYETSQTASFVQSYRTSSTSDETALVPAGLFASETAAEARLLAIAKVTERYLQERFGQSVFAGLGVDPSGGPMSTPSSTPLEFTFVPITSLDLSESRMCLTHDSFGEFQDHFHDAPYVDFALYTTQMCFTYLGMFQAFFSINVSSAGNSIPWLAFTCNSSIDPSAIPNTSIQSTHFNVFGSNFINYNTTGVCFIRIVLLDDHYYHPDTTLTVSLTCTEIISYTNYDPVILPSSHEINYINDNDNWVISSKVIDEIICEPAFATAINNAGGTAIDKGVIRIEKTPGDAYCIDDSYAITVDFTLNDPGIYNDPNVAYATHGADYALKVGNTPWSVTLVNGVYKSSITIPAGQSYVDITIEALNDSISDNNERVYLNIVDAYPATYSFSYGYPFKFSNVPAEDYITIKDAGWWIENVKWVENPYGNELFTEWTGKSVYADKDTPSASNQWTFMDVVVTIGGVVPINGGVVTLDMIDPPNEHDGTYDDNYDESFYFLTSQTLTFMPGQFAKTTEVSVGTHAGNNYIIEATAQNGNPGQGIPHQVKKSEKLTVWRRLWVECDVMQTPNDITWRWDDCVNDVKEQPASVNLSLTKEQMKRACISVIEMPSTWNTQQETYFVHNMDWQPKLDSNFLPIKDAFGRQVFEPVSSPGIDMQIIHNMRRNVKVNETSFWSIHAVGAYEHVTSRDLDHPIQPGGTQYESPILGHSAPSIFIFNETIRTLVTAKQGTASVDCVAAKIMLHEVLHWFLGTHKLLPNGTYDPNDITNQGAMSDDPMSILMNNTDYHLSTDQIRKIQSKPLPTL